MLVRVVNGLMLTMLLGLASAGQAKTFAKVDTWAKRLFHRTVQSKFLKSQQAVVAAVGVAVLSCANMACEKIQQPMTDVFTQSGDPSVGRNVARYDEINGAMGSYSANSVTLTNPDGSTSSDAAYIPIAFHSRLGSFGDFQFTIGDGPYRGVFYGVPSANSGSFVINNALSGGSQIGNGTFASDYTQLVLDGIGVHGEVAATIDVKIYNPEVNITDDSIERTIEVRITDDNSAETITYNTQASWHHGGTNALITSPIGFYMPGYSDIVNAWGGRSSFLDRVNNMGSTMIMVMHEALSTKIYTASNVEGNERLKKSGGLSPYWYDRRFSGVSARLTVIGDTANVLLNKGGSSSNVDIPIGGTVTLGSGFATHDWTLNLGDLMINGSSLYRNMSLSAISASEFRSFRFIGVQLKGSSQYYLDETPLNWDVDASLTASGW